MHKIKYCGGQRKDEEGMWWIGTAAIKKSLQSKKRLCLCEFSFWWHLFIDGWMRWWSWYCNMRPPHTPTSKPTQANTNTREYIYLRSLSRLITTPYLSPFLHLLDSNLCPYTNKMQTCLERLESHSARIVSTLISTWLRVRDIAN